ncbi:MAG: MMPL family transporter [Actinomycetota bacterium]
MLERLGHFLVRRRWFVLVGTIVFIFASGAIGGSVEEHLFNGGFEEPDSESTRAAELLREEFGQAPPNFLLLVEAKDGTVNDADVRKDGLRITNELIREDDVGQVISHFALGAKSPLQSRDSTKALIVAEISGDEDAANEIAADLRSKYTVDWTNTQVRVGGFQAIFDEVSLQIQEDLRKGESIAGVLTLILLIVVFGSLIAAVLPLGIGIISILGTFLVLRLLTTATDVSVFALSMVTAMGLGLAIDYSLFIVSRFREELRAGHDTETAVVITVQTAGRTIIFSAITVAIALSALLVFPLVFFRSFGYAGIGVVLTASVGSVIFLPSALALLGPRVDKLALWKRHPKEVGEGIWHRMAMFVMRRPWPVAITVVAFLLLLGVPFLHVNLGLPDERVLPPGAETRQVHDTIRSDFSTEEVNSIRVVLPNTGDPTKIKKDVANYALGISEVENVGRVETMTGAYADGKKVAGSSPFSVRFASQDSAWLQVIPTVDPFSKEAEAVAKQIRADGSSTFDEIVVGGSSAQLVDVKDTMFSALPRAIAIIGVVTFILLFLMFGSLLVPLKALVLNLLSLTATFGAMVWIFQDGHLSGVLDFTATGQLDISSPILMFCIAFGLSMDYEVFLLSRIKEEYDRTGDNVTSVAIGLERTGRIVTAAAVLISVVFLAIGASSVRFIKLFGIGMALAVLMDAFVIRGTLVPAFMRLAGRANWWLPSWLQGFQRRFAISESIEADEPQSVVASETRPKPTPKPKPKVKPKAKAKAKAKPKTKAKAGAKRKPTAARKTTAKR